MIVELEQAREHSADRRTGLQQGALATRRTATPDDQGTRQGLDPDRTRGIGGAPIVEGVDVGAATRTGSFGCKPHQQTTKQASERRQPKQHPVPDRPLGRTE